MTTHMMTAEAHQEARAQGAEAKVAGKTEGKPAGPALKDEYKNAGKMAAQDLPHLEGEELEAVMARKAYAKAKAKAKGKAAAKSLAATKGRAREHVGRSAKVMAKQQGRGEWESNGMQVREV